MRPAEDQTGRPAADRQQITAGRKERTAEQVRAGATMQTQQITAGRAAEMIAAAAARYETENPKPDAGPADRAFLAWYRGLLIHLGRQAAALQVRDLQTLDALFSQVYVPFSLRSGIIPKIIDFCLMFGLDYNTLNNNINNKYPQFSSILQSWNNLCREYLLQSMTDSSTSNVNHIFIAKAVFGLSDQQKPAETAAKRITSADRAQIVAELSGNVENLEQGRNTQDIENHE